MDLNLLAGIPNLLAAAKTPYLDIISLRPYVDGAKYHLLQGIIRALATPPAVPTVDLMMALLAAGATNGGVSISQPAPCVYALCF